MHRAERTTKRGFFAVILATALTGSAVAGGVTLGMSPGKTTSLRDKEPADDGFWDRTDACMELLCGVVRCYEAHTSDPGAAPVEAKVEARVDAYRSGGIVPDPAPAAVAEVLPALDALETDLDAHPGVMTPSLECELRDAIKDMRLDLQTTQP